MSELFPKPPRRMKQPTKAFLRAQLATAAEQIEQLQRALSEPWWRRWARRALSPLILAAASWWPRKPKEVKDVANKCEGTLPKDAVRIDAFNSF